MIPKKVTIPFKYCSLKRASSFLSEVTERCIEVSDLQNLLRERIIKGCIDFSDDTSIAGRCDGGPYNMKIMASINPPEISADSADFNRQMKNGLTEFLRTYTLTDTGEFANGILPWLWRKDDTISKVLPSLTDENNKHFWNIEDDGMDGYSIYSVVSPVGVWQIEQGLYQGVYDILFSKGVFDSDAEEGVPLVFYRIPVTEYKWSGEIHGYTIKADQIILLDEDIKTLIELFCVPGAVEVSCITPEIALTLDVHEHQLKRRHAESSTFIKPKKSREPSRQIKDVVKALVTANPDLGEAAASEPYALHQKIEALLVQKKLPPIDVTPESIGGWISTSSWGE